MAQKVVCFSLCYYALLIWPLILLPEFRQTAVKLAQGGHQCSDREAGDVLGDAQQAKRVRTMGQAPRSLVEIQRPSSRCAPSKSAQGGWVGVRLLRSFTPPPFGLRAPLASDQVARSMLLIFPRRGEPLRSKV